MKYRESQKDIGLRKRFENDLTRGFLRRIKLQTGSLRGLNALDIPFDFPITAIAGKNGAGKSTVLALACCAFHNSSAGFKLPKRKTSYYTFSDFFIQHSNEVPPQGLQIEYSIAYDKWSNAEPCIGHQIRKKIKDGKWNDYDTRVNRTVVFLGIERIVPHSERSQSRSYSKTFKVTPPKGWEKKVMIAVGFILDKTYDDFRHYEHSKYSLPVVICNGATYSGFNMGAGENALFEIFSTIYSAGHGALLVLDEIELGLHAAAQRKLIEKLKDVCDEMKTQVICTTHSKEIFDCLPNDARFYIESVNKKTRVHQGISPDFAFSKMSSINGLEIDIFIEDEVAKAILLAAIPATIRSRATFKVIGSANVLSRQLSARYISGETKPVLAIFDGDQQSKYKDNLSHATKMAEKIKPDFPQWFEERTCCLPGGTWPEAWLLEKAFDFISPLAAALAVDADDLKDCIKSGQQAGKHNEFYEVARHLGLEQAQCLQHFTTVICVHLQRDLSPVVAKITALIDKNN